MCSICSISSLTHTHTRTTHILTTVQQQHWSAHGCVEKNRMVSKVLSGQRVKHITAVFTETEPDGTNVSLKNSSPHLQKHLFLQLPGGYYNSCHYARPSFLSAEQPLQKQIPLNVLRQTMQSYRGRAQWSQSRSYHRVRRPWSNVKSCHDHPHPT